MLLFRHRRIFFLLLLGLLITPAALLRSEPPPKEVDPEETRLHFLMDSRLAFKNYVFAEHTFPTCDFEQPKKVADLLSAYTIKTTFYDANYRQVEEASSPGIYGAIVEIVPKSGRPLHRYATLYRTREKLDTETLARLLGLDANILRHQAEFIGKELRIRDLDEMNHDQRAARLLGGLSLAKDGPGLFHKYDDAFALERQYWVDLKRKLNGTDKEFSKLFVAPNPVKGAAAPVVREGTLAEAGMKADAADKIDAVCKTWAADDDQAFAVCIVRHGVIVLHKAYGDRDGKPMTIKTKSWMASITKAMSATLMMMLVDQGLVDLDDRVDKFIPALRDIKVETPLTIRHLYTHTNGLNKWPGWNDEMPDLEERIADYYPKLQVGKEWAYNGTGYELGGKIIETVSGEAIPQFFWHHLLKPLDCHDTDVIGTHADAQSVPLDIAKFGQMLLNKGAYGNKRFMREETFEKMLPDKLTKVLGPDATKRFGIGLDGPDKEHFGHGAASSATFHIDRKEDLIVVMTRNKGGKNQDKYNGKFWDALKASMEKPSNAKPE